MISYVDLLTSSSSTTTSSASETNTIVTLYVYLLVASRLLPFRCFQALVAGCCRFYDRSCSGIARLPHLVARYTGDLWRHAALSRLSSQARLPAARIRAIARARSTVSHSETRKKSASFKRRDTRYAGARDERYIVVRELSLDRILSLLGNLREI